MKNILILGAGSSGTMMVNHLDRVINKKEWQLTIVDQLNIHYYQPGFLFLPFGIYNEEDIIKPEKEFIPEDANWINARIDRIDPENCKVYLADDTVLNYDILIIATGSKIAPQEVDGMSGPWWHNEVFDFYTFEGAMALRKKLQDWEGGKLVVHISEMPIKCPVAPLEFAFLADSFFKHKNMRDKVEIYYVTPLSGAFTKPKASNKLHYLLEEKNIHVVTDFYIEKVDGDNRKIVDYGGKEVEYDLLVTVPVNMGDEAIARSGLGDDLNFVPVNHGTLQSLKYENIFALGDAANVPTSKAGSVAHFEAEVLTENIQRYINNEPLKEAFDGHANCFIETGDGKALIIDFNYYQEPVEGTFPIPGIGPFKLLEPTRMNHWGKMAFRWIYFNILLKGYHIPFITPQMQTAGKKIDS